MGENSKDNSIVSQISRPQYNYTVSLLKTLADKGLTEYDSLLRTYVQKASFDMEEEVARVPLSDDEIALTEKALSEAIEPSVIDYFGDGTPAFDTEKEELKRRYDERHHIDDISRGTTAPRDSEKELEGRTESKVGKKEDDMASLKKAMVHHDDNDAPERSFDDERVYTEDESEVEESSEPEDSEEAEDENPAEAKERKKKMRQKEKAERKKKQAKEFHEKQRREKIRRQEEARRKQQEEYARHSANDYSQPVYDNGSSHHDSSAYDINERQEQMRRDVLDRQREAEEELKRHTEELSREARERDENARRFAEENAKRGAQYDIYTGSSRDNGSASQRHDNSSINVGNENQPVSVPQYSHNVNPEQEYSDNSGTEAYHGRSNHTPSYSDTQKTGNESPYRDASYVSPYVGGNTVQDSYDSPKHEYERQRSENVSSYENTSHMDAEDTVKSPDTYPGQDRVSPVYENSYDNRDDNGGGNTPREDESHSSYFDHSESGYSEQNGDSSPYVPSYGSEDRRPDYSGQAKSPERPSNYAPTLEQGETSQLNGMSVLQNQEYSYGNSASYEDKSTFEQNQMDAREDDRAREEQAYKAAQADRIDNLGESARERARSADEYARTHSGSYMHGVDDTIHQTHIDLNETSETQHYRENYRNGYSEGPGDRNSIKAGTEEKASDNGANREVQFYEDRAKQVGNKFGSGASYRSSYRPEGTIISNASSSHGNNTTGTREGEKDLNRHIAGSGFYTSLHPTEKSGSASFSPEKLMEHREINPAEKQTEKQTEKPRTEDPLLKDSVITDGSTIRESSVPGASFGDAKKHSFGSNFVKVFAPTAALVEHLSVRKKAEEKEKKPFEVKSEPLFAGIFSRAHTHDTWKSTDKPEKPVRHPSNFFNGDDKSGRNKDKFHPAPDKTNPNKEESENRRFSELVVGTMFAGQSGRRLVTVALQGLGSTITSQVGQQVRSTDVGQGASMSHTAVTGAAGLAGALYTGAHLAKGGIVNLGKFGATAAYNIGAVGHNFTTYVTGRDFKVGSNWEERKNAYMSLRKPNLSPVRKNAIWKVINSYASGERDFRGGEDNGHFSGLFVRDKKGNLKKNILGHPELNSKRFHSELKSTKSFLKESEELKVFLSKRGMTMKELLRMSPEEMDKLSLSADVKSSLRQLGELKGLKNLNDVGTAMISAYGGVRRVRRMNRQFQNMMEGSGGENGVVGIQLAIGSTAMIHGGLKFVRKSALAVGQGTVQIGDHLPGTKQLNNLGREKIKDIKDAFSKSKQKAKEAFRKQIMDKQTGLVGQIHGGIYGRLTKGKFSSKKSPFKKLTHIGDTKGGKAARKVTAVIGSVVTAPIRAVNKAARKVGQFFSLAGQAKAVVRKYVIIAVAAVFVIFIALGTLMALITYVWSTLGFDSSGDMQKYVDYTTKTVVKDWKEGNDDKKEVNGRKQNQKELYDQGNNATGRYRLITTNYVDKAGNKVDANDNVKDVISMVGAKIENDWPDWKDNRVWPWNWAGRSDMNDDDDADMSVHLDSIDVKDMLKGLYLSSHSWTPKEIGPYIYYKEVNHEDVTLLRNPNNIQPNAETYTKQLAGDAEGEACRGPRTFYCLDDQDAVEYSSPYRTEMIKSYEPRSGCKVSFNGTGYYNAGTDTAVFNHAGTKEIHLNDQNSHEPYETNSVSNAHAEGWVKNTDGRDNNHTTPSGRKNDIGERYAKAQAIANAKNTGAQYDGKYIISGSGDEIRLAHGLTNSTKTVHDKTEAPSDWQHYSRSARTGYQHSSSGNGRYEGNRKDAGDTLVSTRMKHGERTNGIPSGCSSYDVEWNSWDTSHVSWSIDGAGSSVTFSWNADANAYVWGNLSLGEGTYSSCPYNSITFYRIDGAYYPEGTTFKCNEGVDTWQCNHPIYNFTCEDYEAYCNGHAEPMLIYYCPGHQEWYCDKNHYDLEINICVDHLPEDSTNYGGKKADESLGIGVKQADGTLADIPSEVDGETDPTQINSKMAIYFDDKNSTYRYHRKPVDISEDPNDDNEDDDGTNDSFYWTEENRTEAEVMAHADWHEWYPEITGIDDTSVDLESSRNFLESYERRYIDHHIEAKDDADNYIGTDGKKHALDPEDPYIIGSLGSSTPNFMTDSTYDELTSKEKQKYTIIYDLPEKQKKLIQTGLRTVGKISYYEHGFASDIGDTSNLDQALISNGWGNDTGAGYVASTEDGHGLNTGGYVTWLMAYCGTPIKYDNGSTVLTPDCRVIWNQTQKVDSEDDLKIGDIGFINSYDNRDNEYKPDNTASEQEKEMYRKEKEVPYNSIGIYIGTVASGQKMWLIASKTQGMVSLVNSDAFQYYRRVPTMN